MEQLEHLTGHGDVGFLLLVDAERQRDRAHGDMPFAAEPTEANAAIRQAYGACLRLEVRERDLDAAVCQRTGPSPSVSSAARNEW
jgi:hypothetical protein